MYLNEYQKMIIVQIITQGNDSVKTMFEEKLTEFMASFSFEYDGAGDNPIIRYHYTPSNQEFKYIVYPDKSEPYYLRKDQISQFLNSLNNIIINNANQDIAKRSTERRLQTILEERPKQINFLRNLQYEMECILHLYSMLEKNNLLITYSQGIDIYSTFGKKLDDQNTWTETLHLIKHEGHISQNTYIKFLTTKTISLPGLKEFFENSFLTIDELNRSTEIKNLRTQTKWVVFGILFSAIISLVTIILPECNIGDHKANTENINELTVKVDELTPNILQPSQLEHSIMTDTDLDSIIEPVISMQ